ncbi:hypothetical protein AGMMS50267_09080 [Spirochaetia bacterium]|nr:hypothetical protein AGMMS50267_09080 [Spirochaetia bacterium]
MKRSILVLAIAAVVAGGVWAQTPGAGLTDDDVWAVQDRLPGFSAFGAESIESASSGGRFSSDIDNYIGVNDYSQDIGTFFFLGGSTDVGATNGDGAIHFGIGKTLGADNYLGLYYGGLLLKASGGNDGADDPNKVATTTWGSNLAVLFGNNAIGGIRLDLLLNQGNAPITDVTTTAAGNKYSYDGKGLTAALSWGKNIGALDPHATVGFKFPDTQKSYDADGKVAGTITENSALYVNLGTYITLSDTTSASVDLDIVNGFGKTTKNEDPSLKGTAGGEFSGNLGLGISKKANLGDKITVSAKVPLDVALAIVNANDVKGDPADVDKAAERYFGLKAGLNLGAKFQATEKFAFYTGIKLPAFNWTVNSWAEGDDQKKDDDPTIKATDWAVEIFGSGSSFPKVELGLTFTPVENLVIGLGLNSLVNSNANTWSLNPANWGGKLAVSYKF